MADAPEAGEVRGQGLEVLREHIERITPKTLRKQVRDSQLLPESFGEVDAFLDARLRLLGRFLEARVGYALTETERP
jgi:hypothetical protein